jgi:hypothetical protein
MPGDQFAALGGTTISPVAGDLFGPVFEPVPSPAAGSPAKLNASSGFIQKATTDPAKNNPMEPRNGKDQLCV